jgi:hypothetical protein
MPLDPNTYAKLDRSRALDDWYVNKFAPLDSTAIYPKIGHKPLYITFDRWNKMP